MKKKFILSALSGLFLFVTLSSWFNGIGASGYGDRTGATSGAGGCGGSGCHGSSTTSSTTITLQLLSSGSPVCVYVPGNSYTIRITATNTASSTLSKWGYQLSAVSTGTTTSKGTLSAPSGGHVGTYSGVSCAEPSGYLSPTTGSGGSGSTYVQDISWVAPSSGTGSVTIFAAVNLTNYSFSADAGDLWNQQSLVISENGGSISGTTLVCAGATTTLSTGAGGGTWASSSTSVATVGTSGVVTGVGGGTSTISYTYCAGTLTTVVSVNPAPAAISGTASVCQGLSTTLSNSSGTGTWASGTTSVATISGTSTVNGISAGTSAITFTLTSTGCKTSSVVTVNPLPSTISGALNVCVSGTTTLTDGGGGTWLSSNTSIATIGTGGVVSGVAPGTSSITYTLPTGCITSAVVTVNPLPAAITGNTVVCPNLTTTLSNTTGTGTWSSSNTSVATVGGGSGTVTGVTGGTATISYTLSTGCSSTLTMSVYAIPPAITGTARVCETLTTTLSNSVGGGTWSSGNTSIATVAGTGAVTGVSSGNANITYTHPVTSCVSSVTFTVNPLPAGITGVLSACQGSFSSISNSSGGGTWSSGNTSIATVGPTSGLVTANTAGTSVMTYTLGTGCIATQTYTVSPLPAPISGSTNICSGSSSTLSDAGGGTWASSNTSVVTIGSTSGIANGVGTFGLAIISYTLPVTGCRTTTTVTVNLLPGAINGTATVCEGATTGLSDGSGGGTWNSSNTSIATVNSFGTVSGISAGTVTISYIFTTTGCYSTKVVTVNPAPASITGTPSACPGTTTALTDATIGGTWASGATTIATVNTSGVVSGNVAGTATITYTAAGCRTTTIVTVNPLPSAITGASSVCNAATTTLSDATLLGSWSSSNTSIATVGASSGIVTGNAVGTATISYTSLAGCSATKTMTVSPTAGAITGSGLLCKGLTLTLSDAGGGTWSSSNTSVASVGFTSGVVSGIAAGSATITYTLASGCKATQGVTVNPLSPITGVTSLCAGLTTTLSDATTGGKWSSSTTSVATIGSTSAFVNTFTAGTSIIDYTLPSGCIASVVMSVVSSPSAITGNTNACVGSPTALSDAGGGTWTSSNTSIATVVLSTGSVTGVATGSATITYSLGTGCNVTTTVTVYPSPAAITGASSVCENGSIPLSDITGSGTWNTANTNITVGSTSGIVNALAAGTAVVSYSLSTGCSAAKSITVNPLPGSVSGQLEICVSANSSLSDAGGGTWSSSNTSIASINSGTGLLTGLSSGTAVITYTLPVTGCATIATATVDPLPSAISGPGSICTGIMTTYTNSGGGTWSSANTIVAVTVTGDVTGLSAGTAIITYYLPTGCSTTKTVTVNTSPAIITGPSEVCELSTAALSDATSGGKWSSSTTSVATVGSTSAIVSGVSAGTTTITYRLTSGCESYQTFTVNPLPGAITGTRSACVSGTTQLSSSTSGGNWSSSNTTVASVDAAGLVSGLVPGTSSIAYALGTGCKVTAVVTVNPLPGSVSGPSDVCTAASITLSDAGAGSWTSGNTTIATVGATSGIVNGVSAGTVVITYTLSTGCGAYKTITVNNTPSGITGTGAICVNATLTLSDATPGGTWSSGATSIATIGTSGTVTGVANGNAAMSYTLSTGCYSTTVVTVNPLPANITGTAQVCAGYSTSLSDATAGGTWSSSITSVATVGTSSGLVSGIAAGTSSIVYALPTGCSASVTMTVNPMPAAISGASSVCVSTTTLLSDSPAGGTWTSDNPFKATIGSSSGLVLGVAAGSTTITYSLSTGCKVTKVMTINPLPFAGTLSGPSFVCVGAAETMSSTISGGSWASGHPSIATINATSGAITGVSSGTATISYSVTNVCGTDTKTIEETIVGLPIVSPITGIDSVCVGYTITLVDTATGGVWSSSDAGVASVSGTGVVTGVATGTAVISFTITTPCGPANAQRIVKVNPVTVCKTLVGTVTGADAFKVYPNPTTGQFIVEIPPTAAGADVTVMDMLGKVIEEQKVTDTRAQKVPFNLSNMPRGSYIVKVSAGDAIFRQKIEIW